MSASGARGPAREPGTPEPEPSPAGLAGDRTALAWTRSALNMAASGTLIARAAFIANLDVLGVLSAIAMAMMALLTWDHGQAIYAERALSGPFPAPQPTALALLTAATVVIAALAILVTILI